MFAVVFLGTMVALGLAAMVIMARWQSGPKGHDAGYDGPHEHPNAPYAGPGVHQRPDTGDYGGFGSGF
jgi:hypothetical protein